MSTINARYKIRHDTDASIQSATIEAYEPLYATDTHKFYISDGATKTEIGWSNVVVSLLEFDESTSTPATLLDPPANAVLLRVVVVVDEASTAGAPTVSVGTSSVPGRDMGTAITDLSNTGLYSTEPYTECGVSGDNIILSITPDSQTFSGRCYLHYAVHP
jgi:hypothetical protein